MSEAAPCWPAFRFQHNSEIRLKPPRKVQGNVSTTLRMVMTGDNLLVFLPRCQQSIYNFNWKPDVNGWFWTVLTQVLMLTESIQSNKSEFSKGRERAQNPKPISTFKLSKLSFPSSRRAWHTPPKVELSSYPAWWGEVAWNGRGKARSRDLGASVTHLWYVLVQPPWRATACILFNVTFPKKSMFWFTYKLQIDFLILQESTWDHQERPWWWWLK